MCFCYLGLWCGFDMAWWHNEAVERSFSTSCKIKRKLQGWDGWQVKRNAIVSKRKWRPLLQGLWPVPRKGAAVLFSGKCHLSYVSQCESFPHDAEPRWDHTFCWRKLKVFLFRLSQVFNTDIFLIFSKETWWNNMYAIEGNLIYYYQLFSFLLQSLITKLMIILFKIIYIYFTWT